MARLNTRRRPRSRVGLLGRFFRAGFQLAALISLAAAGPVLAAGPEFADLIVPTTTLGQYESAALTFRLSRDTGNPYDPAQIQVDAELQGPGGQALLVPAFWFEPYEPADSFTTEHIVTNAWREAYRAVGPGRWAVRVALPKAGQWRGRLVARDAEGSSASEWFSLTCSAGSHHGYLGPAPNGQFLRFTDGAGFVPVGMCVAWARGKDDRDTYDYYLRRLAQAGANAVRIWMCHWAWLEWTPGATGPLKAYAGAGRYNQQEAYNFDRILDLARQQGLFVQFCFGNECCERVERDQGDPYDSWGGNPYNARNGGPCAKPDDFWTSPEARRLYRNRLRYIVARWGHSPNILAWELWNEIGDETEASAAWHAEMADYLRTVDPWRHMVTTSTWVDDPNVLRRTWEHLDLLQLHYPQAHSIVAARQLAPTKPLILGEGPWDPASMIRGGYAAPLLGAAGPPLTWHSGQGSDIETHDLYRPLAALAGFWQGFPAATEHVSKLVFSDLSVAALPGQQYAPVLLYPGFNTWLRRAGQAEFVVPADGHADLSAMSGVLYGSNPDRAPYRCPPTFVVDYLVAGTFGVALQECSASSALQISVDGREALRYEVPGQGRRPPPPDKRWQTVPVPAGRHAITVDLLGPDWMRVEAFALTNYADVTQYPPVTALGLTAGDSARLWVANEWGTANAQLGLGPAPALRLSMRCTGLSRGMWRAKWLDPATGDAVTEAVLRADKDGLALEAPPAPDQRSAILERLRD